jgi:predicted amidohydrolase YtcJ
MRLFLSTFYLAVIMIIAGCGQKPVNTDLIITNGVIYTVDSAFTIAEAMAVNEGKIVATGTTKEILEGFSSGQVLDMQGAPVYPGFIDSHSHFSGYAVGLQYTDLTGCLSFQEVLDRLTASGKPPAGRWIVGRGWDQNLWTVKQFPDNVRLDALFPANPVMIIRIDGHVVLANSRAIEASGILKAKEQYPGQIESKNGRLTGILSESAADMIRATVPKPLGDELVKLLKTAEANCFSVGLTGVSDAGLEAEELLLLDSLSRQGLINMNIEAMLTPTAETVDRIMRQGPFLAGNLSARSVKIYADGSLGSRTAKLKKPYSDESGTSGIIVTQPDSIRALCRLAYEYGYQVNTHCIGDSAVAMILGIYGEFLKQRNDLRWRIEHAQVVDPADFEKFALYSVVPSIQATHATSDMYWAGNRLGPERIKGAYAYKTLLEQNGWIANGTDFPIEQIDPRLTFYASVARKDLKGFPDGGFQMENALTRDETLRSMTIWAARSAFAEQQRGSLEKGKEADFIILDRDIMKIEEKQIPSTKVKATYLRGRKVFANP